MKNNYVIVENVEFSNVIEFNSLTEFSKIIQNKDIKVIYKESSVIKESRYSPEEKLFITENKINIIQLNYNFVYLEDNIAYKLKTNGFLNLEDYSEAFSKGFLLSPVYYTANEKGFESYEQFKKCKELGYITIFDYNKAQTSGFENTKASEYYISKEKGFLDYKEYTKAITLKIPNKEVLTVYETFEKEMIENGFKYHDELFFYKYLKGLRKNKKLSKNKLIEYFRIEQNKIFNNVYPLWYLKRLNTEKDIIEFLVNNINVKKIGEYDSDGEVFEKVQKNKIKNDKIIIDGSNIAWAGGDRSKGAKPRIINIKTIINDLKERGYKKILCIVDASLKHDIDDTVEYQNLLTQNVIQEAPAKSDADKYIIDYLKDNKCYLITNDTFKKDYYQNDDWVRGNIENYRIPFMIIDDTVSFGKDMD